MSLNELYRNLRELIAEDHPGLHTPPPKHEDFRPGDVRHSQADISKARQLLGYQPTFDTRSGLREALPWYEHRANIGRDTQNTSRDIQGVA